VAIAVCVNAIIVIRRGWIEDHVVLFRANLLAAAYVIKALTSNFVRARVSRSVVIRAKEAPVKAGLGDILIFRRRARWRWTVTPGIALVRARAVRVTALGHDSALFGVVW
jgi:hypothetical protein